MATPAKTVYVFGWYLIALAIALILAPNTILNLFGIPSTSEPWIRVVGLLAGVVGYYYLRASAAGFSEFFAWTVPVRIFALLFFCALVVLKLAPAVLVLFGVIDTLGAGWTWLAIRNSAPRA
jgi:hypothetical protein